MIYLNRVSFKTRIGGSFAVIIVILLVVSGITMISLNNIRTSSEQIKNEYMVLITNTSEVEVAVQSFARDVENYILTGDESTYEGILTEIGEIEQKLAVLEEHVSSFKSSRTIMFFNKPNRSCIISVTQKTFSAEVEIWVAPTLEFSDETVLK